MPSKGALINGTDRDDGRSRSLIGGIRLNLDATEPAVEGETEQKQFRLGVDRGSPHAIVVRSPAQMSGLTRRLELAQGRRADNLTVTFSTAKTNHVGVTNAERVVPVGEGGKLLGIAGKTRRPAAVAAGENFWPSDGSKQLSQVDVAERFERDESADERLGEGANGCHDMQSRTRSDTMGLVSNTALFNASADAFLGLLGEVAPDQWESPGLGSWTVRSLAGHTARAILTVETYLGQDEPGSATIPSAEHYYNQVLEQFTDHTSIEQRGVEAGAWLGSDPVDQVRDAINRTKVLIGEQPADRLVSIGGMGILLDEYLRTRVVELIVHSIDLARAIGSNYTPPKDALAMTVGLLAQTAVHRGSGVELLLGLTGRENLPEGFTVV